MENINKITITGMHCASCAKIIEKELASDPNIKTLTINPVNDQAEIVSRGPLDLQKINKKLEKLGYQFKSETTEESPLDSYKQEKLKELAAQKNKLKVALPLMSFILIVVFWSLAAKYLKFEPAELIPGTILMPLVFLVATLIIFWTGRGFLAAALRFFRFGKANMDTLIGIGTGTAYFYSLIIYLFPAIRLSLNLSESYFFDVTIVVITLVYLGKYLENRAKLRTNETISKLLSLQTKTALIEINGQEEEIPLTSLKVNDVVIVKPGMKIPADGLIISGFSAIDESLITGESLPVDKKEGDLVLGATINKNGLLKIKITKVGEETVLATIIKAVETAQNSKAPIQKLADQVAGVFVPFVLVLAALTLAAWLIIAPYFLPWPQAVSLGITCFVSLLAIACPCALGLATPTGIMVGLGLASKNGLLIKNAASLEKFGKTTIMVFDKTGTVTLGQPKITDIITVPGQTGAFSEKKIIKIAASLENGSEHPLAQALINAAKEQNLSLNAINNFQAIPGQGLSANIGQTKYHLGNRKLMTELQINLETISLEKLEKQGKTVIYLSQEKTLVAAIAVADQIKPEAKKAIRSLTKNGIRTIMLSGDRQEVAEYIAAKAGISEVIAEVSPLEKAEKIATLKKPGQVVAMIGDGINDAVALVSADIGIAMAEGSDVAIESADITILNGDLHKVHQALLISRLTMRKIKQNLFWAFFYNLIAIPLAAGALYPAFGLLLSPIVAASAMSLSSLSIIFNTLLMRRVKI